MKNKRNNFDSLNYTCNLAEIMRIINISHDIGQKHDLFDYLIRISFLFKNWLPDLILKK